MSITQTPAQNYTCGSSRQEVHDYMTKTTLSSVTNVTTGITQPVCKWMIHHMNSSNLTVSSGSVPAVDCQTIQTVYFPATFLPQTRTRSLILLQTAETTQIWVKNPALPLHQIQQIPLPLKEKMWKPNLNWGPCWSTAIVSKATTKYLNCKQQYKQQIQT